MRLPVSRRTRVIAALAAAVAVAVVLTVLVRGGGAGAPLVAPRYGPDPVPALRTLSAHDLPPRCGVRAATVRRYAPGGHAGAGRRAHCQWYSLNAGRKRCGFCPSNGGDRERVLEVVISTGTTPTLGRSAGGDALRALDPAGLVTAGTPGRTVTGLGDEALYRYSPALDGGATLTFRVGAAVATVTYSGRDFFTHRMPGEVPEKSAKPAVLAAAADVAGALHARARPAFTPAGPGPVPLRHVPRPCDLVPGAVAGRLAAHATRTRAPVPPAIAAAVATQSGLAADTCAWDAARHLSVTLAWRPDRGRTLAVPEATRLYRESHEDARATGVRALRDLGDQAYAAYGAPPDQRTAEVTYRYRDVIVLVTYSGATDAPLPRATALTGAYTAAVHTFAALSGSGHA